MSRGKLFQRSVCRRSENVDIGWYHIQHHAPAFAARCQSQITHSWQLYCCISATFWVDVPGTDTNRLETSFATRSGKATDSSCKYLLKMYPPLCVFDCLQNAVGTHRWHMLSTYPSHENSEKRQRRRVLQWVSMGLRPHATLIRRLRGYRIQRQVSAKCVDIESLHQHSSCGHRSRQRKRGGTSSLVYVFLWRLGLEQTDASVALDSHVSASGEDAAETALAFWPSLS